MRDIENELYMALQEICTYLEDYKDDLYLPPMELIMSDEEALPQWVEDVKRFLDGEL